MRLTQIFLVIAALAAAPVMAQPGESGEQPPSPQPTEPGPQTPQGRQNQQGRQPPQNQQNQQDAQGLQGFQGRATQPARQGGQQQAPSPDGNIAGKTVENVFVETSLRQALSDVALQTGVPILVSDAVQGTVTLEFEDTPLTRALDMMLASGGYVWQRKDNYILVGSPVQGSPLFMQLSNTRQIELDHLTAQEAINMLAPPLRQYVTSARQPGGEQVPQPAAVPNRPAGVAPAPEGAMAYQGGPLPGAVDDNDGGMTVPPGGGVAGVAAARPDRGRVVITAPPAIIERIVNDLKQIDQPSRHVLLEGRVVVLEQDAMLNLGVEWDFPSLEAGTVTGSDFTDTPGGTDAPWLVSVGLSPGRQFTDSLMLSLNLLKRNEEVSVVSNPELMVSDGESADMGVVTEERFVVNAGVGGFADSDLEVVASGTTLNITPQIGANDTITLDMAVEVSNVVARGQDNLPIVTRRTASSSVELDDGGTAAIAGLMESRTEATERRVPGAGDLPGLLGAPFRNDRSSQQSNQLAVFVTATIVEDAADSLDADRHEPKRPVDPEQFRQQIKDALGRAAADGEALSGALESDPDREQQ